MTKADHLVRYLVGGTLLWASVAVVRLGRQFLTDRFRALRAYPGRVRFQLWYLGATPEEVRAYLHRV